MATCLIAVGVVHVLGVVITASFIVVAMLGDTSTSELHRVVVIDVAAVGMLTAVAASQMRHLVR